MEEGYITFTSLPASFLLKAGKMRAQFGKVNTLHTHAMPTVDRPLVTENLVGGEEGLSDAGLSLSQLIQNPYLFLEATGEVYAAASDVFQTTTRSRLNYVGRLRALSRPQRRQEHRVRARPSRSVPPSGFVDPSEAPADLRLEQAALRRRRDVPLPAAPPRHLPAAQSQNRDRVEPAGHRGRDAASRRSGSTVSASTSSRAAGTSARGSIARRARSIADSKDNGGAVFLTFWPTEFSQIRTQYRRSDLPRVTNANEVMFQLNFSIGAHGAHAF